jgi:hypothetical protein
MPPTCILKRGMIMIDSLMESEPAYLLALLNEWFSAPPFGPQLRASAPHPLHFTIVPANPEMTAEANKHFVETLRSLVDQWLYSGRSGTVEVLRERNLGLGTDRDGLGDVLRFWIAQDRFHLSFANSGELEMDLPCRESTGDAFADAKNDAIRLCAKLLQSPLRYRIAKCCKPQCGRYFYYRRAPKGLLKCGTLCPDHKIHGATIRKDRQRRLRKERLLKLASTAWHKCSVDQTDSYRWMAGQVNKHLRHEDQRITKRFITQNADLIESIAEKHR